MRLATSSTIGSDTKAMTATLLGILVEEAKLAWSSTVRGVFPARAKSLHPSFQGVSSGSSSPTARACPRTGRGGT